MFDNPNSIAMMGLFAVLLTLISIILYTGRQGGGKGGQGKGAAIDLGHQYYQAHRFLEAIKSYKEALRTAPKDQSIYLRIGQCYQHLGNLTDAERVYRRALEVINNAAECCLELARVTHRQGKSDTALNAINQFLAKEPGHVGGRKLKVQILMDTRQYDAACELLVELAAIEPDNLKLRTTLADLQAKIGKSGDALKLYDGIASQDKQDRKNMKYRMAALHMDKKQYDEAIALLKNILATNTGMLNPADLHADLARCLESKALAAMENQSYDAAIGFYQDAMQNDPSQYGVHYGLGCAFAKKRRAQAAIDCFRKAIEMKPNLPEPYLEMVAMHEYLGQYNEAITCMLNLQDISPTAKGLYHLGRLYMSKGDQFSSINYFNLAIDADPHLADAYFGMAQLLEKQRKPREALKYYKQTLHEDANYPQAQENFTSLKLKLNIR